MRASPAPHIGHAAPSPGHSGYRYRVAAKTWPVRRSIGGDAALNAVYDSGGSALEAGEDEIIATGRALAREGFAVEPASAVAVACARRETAPEYSGETWVAVGTGSTVKWPQSICAGFVRPPDLPDDFTDIDQLIAEVEYESS